MGLGGFRGLLEFFQKRLKNIQKHIEILQIRVFSARAFGFLGLFFKKHQKHKNLYKKDSKTYKNTQKSFRFESFQPGPLDFQGFSSKSIKNTKIYTKKTQKHTKTHRNPSDLSLFSQGLWIFRAFLQKASKTQKSIQKRLKNIQKHIEILQI